MNALKKNRRKIFLFSAAALLAAGGCILGAYCSAAAKFKAPAPIGTVYGALAYEGAAPGSVFFIHAVNTPHRAKVKENSFKGFEVDLIAAPEGKIFVAHDARGLKAGILPEDIFAAMRAPGEHLFWLDLKSALTEPQLSQITAAANKYGVPLANLLFETGDPATINLLHSRNLKVMLAVTDAIDKDGGDPALREEINKELSALIELYRPYAVAGSLGKYPYLKTYFPNIRKAAHYSTVKRPGIKKYFLRRQAQKDPNLFFMTDEYTFLPF